jgi:lysophospholipase L1-like esterase
MRIHPRVSKSALSIIIGLEIIVVLVLIWAILSGQTGRVLGIQVNTTPIRKENLIFGSSQNLRYFYEFKPNQKFTEGTYWTKDIVTYTINNDSLNDTSDYPFQKDPQTYRIVTLGDSFTMGAYVNTSGNWTELLESQLNKNQKSCPSLNKVEVINLGVEGYDPEYEVERYRLRGQKYKPDLVIWFLLDNDFNDINELTIGKSKQSRDIVKAYLSENSATYTEEFNIAWRRAHKLTVRDMGFDKIIQYQFQQLLRFKELYSGNLLIITDKSIPQEVLLLLEKYISDRPNSQEYLLESYDTFIDGHPSYIGHEQIANQLVSPVTNIIGSGCR